MQADGHLLDIMQVVSPSVQIHASMWRSQSINTKNQKDAHYKYQIRRRTCAHACVHVRAFAFVSMRMHTKSGIQTQQVEAGVNTYM